MVDGFDVNEGPDGVLVLTGDLDAQTAPVLDAAVQRLVSAGHERVVLDLGMLGFVDSSGLRSMILARGPDGDREVELRSASRAVLRLLDITGLTDSFTIT